MTPGSLLHPCLTKNLITLIIMIAILITTLITIMITIIFIIIITRLPAPVLPDPTHQKWFA